METRKRPWRWFCTASRFLTLFGASLVAVTVTTNLEASIFKFLLRGQHGDGGQACEGPAPLLGGSELSGEPGGTWYWLRSPEEEKRVIIGLYTRYCVRCHGVNGHGVWDIPDVPDFSNAVWQSHRSDGQLTRAILEGRGACMPPFRGTITLEEAWAMSRYLRTFVPGTEISRPEGGRRDGRNDLRKSEEPVSLPQLPAPKKLK